MAAGSRASGVLMILGTVVFSGSLYSLVFTGVKKWGMITPIGGTLFLDSSWLILFVLALPRIKS